MPNVQKYEIPLSTLKSPFLSFRPERSEASAVEEPAFCRLKSQISIKRFVSGHRFSGAVKTWFESAFRRCGTKLEFYQVQGESMENQDRPNHA